jgi:hypothetical protein
MVLILPGWTPLTAQTDPEVAAQVQVTLLSLSGKMSETPTPLTALGPLFVTVIEYVFVWPGMMLVRLSVFDRLKLTLGVRVSVSMAKLSMVLISVIPAGTVTFAEFINRLVAVGERLTLATSVAVPPTDKSTKALIFPTPLGV